MPSRNKRKSEALADPTVVASLPADAAEPAVAIAAGANKRNAKSVEPTSAVNADSGTAATPDTAASPDSAAVAAPPSKSKSKSKRNGAVASPPEAHSAAATAAAAAPPTSPIAPLKYPPLPASDSPVGAATANAASSATASSAPAVAPAVAPTVATVSTFARATAAPAPVLRISNSFDSVRARVLTQLSANFMPSRVIGLDAQCDSLHEFLRPTLDGQNTAVLCVGARGSGKSLAVRHVLQQLTLAAAKNGPSSSGSGGGGFVTIRLNGYIQTDDTLAMREIVRQLCMALQMEVPTDEQFGVPPEQPQPAAAVSAAASSSVAASAAAAAAAGARKSAGTNFPDHLSFVLDTLQSNKHANRPIFFILDEFHEFAERGKQTLLYNLCDLLQSGSAQIALVGITTKLDVESSLEKRVKSRLQPRRIQFTHQSIETVKQILTHALSVPFALSSGGAARTAGGDAKSKSKKSKKEAAAVAASSAAVSNSSSFYRVARPAIAPLPSDASYIERYNHSVLTTFNDDEVNRAFEFQVDLGREMRFFFTLATAAASRLTPAVDSKAGCLGPLLTPAHILRSLSGGDELSDDRIELSLRHCTVLEWFLLIAMTHLERKLVIPYNFELVYDEWKTYQTRANASLGVPLSPKKVCLKAFEQLMHRELIRFADQKTGTDSVAAAAAAAATAASAPGGGANAGAAHSSASLAPLLSFPVFARANNAGGGGVGGTASYTQKSYRTVRLTLAPEHIREFFKKHPETGTFLAEYASNLD